MFVLVEFSMEQFLCFLGGYIKRKPSLVIVLDNARRVDSG